MTLRLVNSRLEERLRASVEITRAILDMLAAGPVARSTVITETMALGYAGLDVLGVLQMLDRTNVIVIDGGTVSLRGAR